MKYMHFRASCSYAGLANLLALAGEDALAGTLQQVQDSLMRFLRGPRQAPLSQALDVDALCSAARAYAVRIRREAACTR